MAKDNLPRDDKFVEMQEKKAEEKKEESVAVSPASVVAAPASAPVASRASPKKEEKAAPAKPAEKKEEKPVEKKRDIVLERIYSIPLGDAYARPQMKRADRATDLLKAYLSRHMKSQDIRMSVDLNNTMRARGSRRPMKKVKVRATKDKEGMVWAELAA